MMQNTDFGGQGFPGAGSGLITAICGAPIAALISVVLFALMTGVVQLIAKLFGGSGSFEQLAYALAAILTPFYVVSSLISLLGAIPFVGACFGILGLAIALYVLVLEVMAVKGVNQFGWGQALVSLLLPVFALICCVLVGAFAFFQAVGPDILEEFRPFLTPVP